MSKILDLETLRSFYHIIEDRFSAIDHNHDSEYIQIDGENGTNTTINTLLDKLEESNNAIDENDRLLVGHGTISASSILQAIEETSASYYAAIDHTHYGTSIKRNSSGTKTVDATLTELESRLAQFDSWDEMYTFYYDGYANRISNLNAIPVTRKTVVATLTDSSNLSIAMNGTMKKGTNITVLCMNRSSSDKTINLRPNSNWTGRGASTVIIPSNTMLEFYILYYGDGLYYIAVGDGATIPSGLTMNTVTFTQNGSNVFKVNDATYYTSDASATSGSFNIGTNITSLRYFLNVQKNIKTIDVSGLDLGNCTTIQGAFRTLTSSNADTNLVEITGLDTWNTSNVTDMTAVFQGRKSLQSINIGAWDTSKVTTLAGLLNECESLETVSGLGSWDVSKATSLAGMFRRCTKITTIGNLTNWNVSLNTSFQQTFNKCYLLQSIGDISNWDVSNCTDFQSMFGDCSSLENIGNLTQWNVSNATTMRCMFYNCENLVNLGDISTWNTSKVTDMAGMFQGCSKLSNLGDLGKWNTSQVTNMLQMFTMCSSLKTSDIQNIKKWDVSKVTRIKNMFANTWELDGTIDLSGWNTSSLTDCCGLFCMQVDNIINPNSKASKIKAIKCSRWDVSKVTNAYHMFDTCDSLEEVYLDGWKLPSNCDVGDMFRNCTSLKRIYLRNTDTTTYHLIDDVKPSQAVIISGNTIVNSHFDAPTTMDAYYDPMENDSVRIISDNGVLALSENIPLRYVYFYLMKRTKSWTCDGVMSDGREINGQHGWRLIEMGSLSYYDYNCDAILKLLLDSQSILDNMRDYSTLKVGRHNIDLNSDADKDFCMQLYIVVSDGSTSLRTNDCEELDGVNGIKYVLPFQLRYEGFGSFTLLGW